MVPCHGPPARGGAASALTSDLRVATTGAHAPVSTSISGGVTARCSGRRARRGARARRRRQAQRKATEQQREVGRGRRVGGVHVVRAREVLQEWNTGAMRVGLREEGDSRWRASCPVASASPVMSLDHRKRRATRPSLRHRDGAHTMIWIDREGGTHHDLDRPRGDAPLCTPHIDAAAHLDNRVGDDRAVDDAACGRAAREADDPAARRRPVLAAAAAVCGQHRIQLLA